MNTTIDHHLIEKAMNELNQSVKEMTIGLKDIVKILAKKRQVRKVCVTDKPDVLPWGQWQLKWSPEEYRTLWRYDNERP